MIKPVELFSLLQTARRQNLPIDVVMDLFDKMVVPVLLYGCEIWGYENLSLLEKLQLKAIKFMLHLHKSTNNAMVYTAHIKLRATQHLVGGSVTGLSF